MYNFSGPGFCKETENYAIVNPASGRWAVRLLLVACSSPVNLSRLQHLIGAGCQTSESERLVVLIQQTPVSVSHGTGRTVGLAQGSG